MKVIERYEYYRFRKYVIYVFFEENNLKIYFICVNIYYVDYKSL